MKLHCSWVQRSEVMTSCAWSFHSQWQRDLFNAQRCFSVLKAALEGSLDSMHEIMIGVHTLGSDAELSYNAELQKCCGQSQHCMKVGKLWSRL